MEVAFLHLPFHIRAAVVVEQVQLVPQEEPAQVLAAAAMEQRLLLAAAA